MARLKPCPFKRRNVRMIRSIAAYHKGSGQTSHGINAMKAVPALLIALASVIALAQNGNPPRQKQVSPGDVVATHPPLDPFPGGVGSYWIYQGLVRSQGPGNKVAERKVRWRMSVERVLRRDDATAVVVKGFPGDLDWSEGDSEAKESVFAWTYDGRIYRFEWRTGNPEEQFANIHVPIPELLDKADLMFQWPPVVGAQPGGGNCPERDDEMYCWILFGAPREVSLRGIRGVKPGSYTAYSIAYRTNPDHEIIDLVPGVGVTAYEYSHHGTVSDVDVHLIELYLAREK
jgi:hypothetical protein